MPAPFSDLTVDAVAACTRALAMRPDADSGLASTDAATVSALRAAGDRLAIRRRHHDPHIDAAHRPPHERAAEVFAALELGRLDALGVRWLRGIGRNLLAHPGSASDGVRWLAFEALSGHAAPPSKTDLVDRVRRSLPAGLRDRLAALAGLVDDQARFAERASAWASDALAALPPDTTQASGSILPSPLLQRRRRQLPTRGDPGGTSAPLKRQRRDASSSGGDGYASGNAGAIDPRLAGYHAYTTAHDRVVNAASLAERGELAQLRDRLEQELASIKSVESRLAKQLLRVLMARQARQWQFDLEEGQLDAARLAAFVAGRGAARPFKQEAESPFPSTVVTLLIDHSGSMRGRPMLIAALTVEIFARVLERCGVKCEVLGFTTRDWDGGEPAQEWAANGYPENPGRLNALQHIIIKGADVPWRRARAALGLFLHDDMLKENIDGEALAWAHGRLLSRSERRRILVVVSDGTPMDEATMAANGYEFLDGHLQAVVEDIETRSPVQLAAIGIGHDVSRFYRNATTIGRIEQLGPALTRKLIDLLMATSADVG